MIDVELLIAKMCTIRDISVEDFYHSKDSQSYISRYMVWSYMQKHGYTSNAIAAYFGRSRRQIMRGLRTLRNLVKYHTGFRDVYESVMAKLGD